MYQIYYDNQEKLQVAKLDDIMAAINTKGNIDENWLKAEIEYLIDKRCLRYVDRGHMGMPAMIRITPYGIEKTKEIAEDTIDKAQGELDDGEVLQAVKELKKKNHAQKTKGLAHKIQEYGKLAGTLARVFSNTLSRRSVLSA